MVSETVTLTLDERRVRGLDYPEGRDKVDTVHHSYKSINVVKDQTLRQGLESTVVVTVIVLRDR